MESGKQEREEMRGKKKNYTGGAMDEEQRKSTRRTTLQEERVFPVLEMIESESEMEDTTSDDEEFDWAVQSGLDLSEDDDEGYDFSEDMEEDDVDPDQLSYEELVALGEMVGVEKRGLSEAEMSRHLHPVAHSTTTTTTLRCVICQVEYEQGEEDQVVTLHCDHLYHKDCISKWLQIKKNCPICNYEVVERIKK